jgi:arginyl-tRNA synthetase
MKVTTVKYTLLPWLTQGICSAQPSLGQAAQLPTSDFEALVRSNLKLERPRHAEHGDYAVNVSFLAKVARLAPPVMATQVAETLAPLAGVSVSVVAGFINLRVDDAQLLATLLPVLTQAERAGQNASLANETVLLEYVSANPTGPLHVGHGRWAALGDSLRRILERNGATVCAEFYVNDYGQQMTNMANSLWFRCLEQLNLAAWPQPVEGETFPYYPGEYVVTLAQQYLAEEAHCHAISEAFAFIGPQRLEIVGADFPLLQELRTFSRDAMLALQRQLLERFRTRFDVWQLETDLHTQGLVAAGLNHLKTTGFTYENDGALWLKSSAFGDEKDRVLVKADGSYTYLTADIAYHDLKYRRPEGFNRYIDIWGADHHGYIPRMKAAIQALNHPVEAFEVLLGQLVNLVVDGAKTRMGKRKTMLTLEDIIDEVGVDATRFWLVMRSADSTLEFDVDLAASSSDENPVFYTQYAHARCCGILRQATQASPSTEHAPEGMPPRFTLEAVDTYRSTLTPEAWAEALMQPLKQDSEKNYATVRDLILFLMAFTEKVEDAGRVRTPHLIARYALDLAGQFHSFYGACRVLCADDSQALARLALVRTLQLTLAEALDLLGVSAPETM